MFKSEKIWFFIWNKIFLLTFLTVLITVNITNFVQKLSDDIIVDTSV